jgi:catechol 2,3-dioxygenase-like lactoylglutathione lyase family enzyme
VNVRRLCWLGVRTDEYERTVALFRDVMGMRVEFERSATTELSLPSGDRVQVFAPGDHYYDFFGRHAHGPVALFEVDDVQAARRELEAAGIEVIGDIEHDDVWEWLHVRGPDGNLYELASTRGANTCS